MILVTGGLRSIGSHTAWALLGLELVPGEEVEVEWHEAEQDRFQAVADRVERHAPY